MSFRTRAYFAEVATKAEYGIYTNKTWIPTSLPTAGRRGNDKVFYFTNITRLD